MRISGWRKTTAFFALCSLLYILNWLLLPDFAKQVPSQRSRQPTPNCSSPDHPSHFSSLLFINCSADFTSSLKCLRDGENVFVPFSFISKHFDLSGRFRDDGFEWQTSYAKIKVPEGAYDPRKSFGHFSSYSVHTRDRVRCINPISGVPMSTQWNATPYYYPIQIAQYGLQFYSRMVETKEAEEVQLAGRESKDWKGSLSSMDETSERVFFTNDNGTELVNISSSATTSSPGVYVHLLQKTHLHVLSISVLPYSFNSSFSIFLSLTDSKQTLVLNYVPDTDDRCVWPDANDIGTSQMSFSYSLPWNVGEWLNITRDLLTDASRALSSRGKASKKASNVILKRGDILPISISFRGNLCVKQRIEQRRSADEIFFMKAAEWLLHSQDGSGGWGVPVERSMAEHRLLLSPPWHSAMAQGHAISLLVRAAFHSQHQPFLIAAERALDLFEKPSSEGGVRALFLGVLPWYEEYPTQPSSFVLNGFLYSLIGLHDLASMGKARAAERAKGLFLEGIRSLKQLLPLFDSGSRSFYDLRHVSLHLPPNLARWDYHAVHVYLLKWISSIVEDKDIDDVAERWILYAHGKAAKHN